MKEFSYKIFCGNPFPPGEMHPYSFTESAPASLCVPGPDEDAMGVFIVGLVEKHHNEVLSSRLWKCVVCNKPATELLHQPIPVLHLPKPEVMETVVPICSSGGECDAKAGKQVTSMFKLAIPMINISRNCEVCGKRMGAKKCKGCMVIRYIHL